MKLRNTWFFRPWQAFSKRIHAHFSSFPAFQSQYQSGHQSNGANRCRARSVSFRSNSSPAPAPPCRSPPSGDGAGAGGVRGPAELLALNCGYCNAAGKEDEARGAPRLGQQKRPGQEIRNRDEVLHQPAGNANPADIEARPCKARRRSFHQHPSQINMRHRLAWSSIAVP